MDAGDLVALDLAVDVARNEMELQKMIYVVDPNFIKYKA